MEENVVPKPVNPVQDKLDQLDNSLNNYEVKGGLPKIPEISESSIEELIDVNSIPTKMTPEEYAEAALKLSRFAFYVQRLCNKEQSRFDWLTSQIHKTITPHLGQVKAYGWVERELVAISNDDHAQRLNTEKIKAGLKLTRLSYLGGKLESIAEKYVELSRCARNRKLE